ncbi:MAG: hypothetical protein JKY96_06040 [Phycisphaerales bacterium]|nr:hypothetical protein [Phycisphaerales bacterium]
MKRNRARTVGMILAIAGLSAIAGAEVFVIELNDFSFTYDGMSNMDIDLTIAIGDTVQWNWVSGFHNVVSGLPGAADSGDLFFSGPPTADDLTTFEYTFMETGVFDFHCHVHGTGGMASFVTVVPAPGSMLAMAPLGLVMMRRRR